MKAIWIYLIKKFQNSLALIFVIMSSIIPFFFLKRKSTIMIITRSNKINTIINEIPPRLLSNLSFSSRPSGKLSHSTIYYLSKEERLITPSTVFSISSALAGKFMPQFRHTSNMIWIIMYISNSEEINFFATTYKKIDITIVVVETSDATFAKLWNNF